LGARRGFGLIVTETCIVRGVVPHLSLMLR